ncbi:hypothetical protein PG990_015216 [Apiospora arundinis]
MTSVLGKRKSRRAEKDPAEVAAAQEKLRKYFESQYAPITATADTKKEEEEEGDGNGEVADERSDDESAGDDNEGSGSDSDEDDDEWGGLSEDDEDTTTAAAQQPQIEVVEHTDISRPTSLDPTLRKASRAYLSSKPPKDEDTATLLRDDLALQRLLTESHLFNSTFGAAGAGNGVEHEGRNRHKATDLRLAALGSKDSIYKQAKMPMGHRKGIIAAAEKREDKRRREARENGIVLERATAGVHEGWTGLKGKKSRTTSSAGGGGRKREAAVDAPAVGKLRNGLLQLSKKDIREIEGSGGGSSRGGKGVARSAGDEDERS